MDFENLEYADGVRFSFNTIPSTTQEAARSIAPIAAIVKPLHFKPDLPVVNYEPIKCKNINCGAFLNPHCMIDVQARAWHCPICMNRNLLPPQYSGIQHDNLPVEMAPESTSIEYILPNAPQLTPIFILVVDTCQEDEDLKALKDSLMVSISLLPKNALIALITFGSVINVHELGYESCIKSIAFNGARSYASHQIKQALGLHSTDLRSHGPQVTASAQFPISSRYVRPVQEVEFELSNTIEQFCRNPFKVPHDQRHKRGTGTALNVALTLLECGFPPGAARIMLFAGGPCTIGPGTIVDPALREPLRSHSDIDADNKAAKHYKTSYKYYDTLATRAAKWGAVVDIFAGCYDQIGLYEMRSLPQSTGGVMILTDSFSTSIFRQSFIRLLSSDDQGFLEMGFLGTMTVRASKELKVSGLLGSAKKLNSKGSFVAETEIGQGGTFQWKMCGIGPNSSYAVFFDAVNQNPPTVLGNDKLPTAFIQFSTQYLHSSGSYRIRVATVKRPLSILTAPVSSLNIDQSFDQEATAAILARMAVDKTEKGSQVNDVIRFLDNMLIKLCMRFSQSTKGDMSSFKLPAQFTYFPQFMYHLRRSQFLQVFNNSPDETIYYRHVLMQEDTTNSCIMIQPTLTAYQIDKEPEPVLLDIISVKSDVILLLDTFFHLLIYHGETIAQWRKAGFQDMEEYENFKQLLQEPRKDAADLLTDRFPLPRFIDTEARGSQARFLFSRLNPSKSNSDKYGYTTQGERVLTDDVSLQDFMEYLIRLVMKMDKNKKQIFNQ